MTEQSTQERLGRILRIAACLMSFGFIFPHALMESADAEKLAAKALLEAAEAADKAASRT